MHDQWVMQMDVEIMKFNTKVLNFMRFGFRKKSKETRDIKIFGILMTQGQCYLHDQWVMQMEVEIMKFNTKVLNFMRFGFLQKSKELKDINIKDVDYPITSKS